MPVSITAELAAPIAKVWDLVSDFPGLKRWHPLVERCETRGSGVGAIRTVHFADWWAAERLESLDREAHSFTYAIVDSDRRPIIGVRGRMSLVEVKPGVTQLTWQSGLEDGNEHAATVNGGLAAYYPLRVGHLKAALGIPA
ncbi:MAG TPA: SRPBCC family protein [Steroidobacteraceae bacterium]|nr:SRPBCC family protein [Steroidobacteraceae bacterium]